MSIVSVDNIQPIGSGTSVTVNSAATLVLNNLNSTGIITTTGADINGDLDVDGHTNLDNVSIVGVTTFNGLSTNDVIRVRSADTNGISVVNILSEGTTGSSRILFSDTAATSGDGWISYSHNDRALLFTTAGTSNERFRITSTGQFKIGNNPTAASGTFTHIEAPSGFNSGETIVQIVGDSSTTGPRLNLQNRNTGANASSEIIGSDSGGQSTSTIRMYHTDQSNNYGEIAFGTRNNAGVPPVDRMRISKDGYVTQANRPAFDAGISTGAVSATNPIIFNQIQLNRGSHYDNSNGRFTAPITGLYFFYFGGLKNNNSNVLRLKLRKNGGSYVSNREFRLDENGGSYGENASMCVIASLSATDYVQVYVTEGTVYGQYTSYTYFGGYLLA